ncbi:MAG: GNAT family N-acetyltransferase [Candidatus Hermodarchaeota archaeon]
MKKINAKIEVNSFNLGQEELVCQIHNGAFNDWIKRLGSLYAYHKIEPKEVLMWSQEPKKSIWLAYMDGNPAGYVCCQLNQLQGKNTVVNLLYEETKESLGQSKIAVLPNYRRKGVAKTLLIRTMEHYKTLGAETAIVISYSDNTAASALMSALGFDHRDFYYYPPYSDEEPYIQEDVLAELYLNHPLTHVRLNSDVMIRKLQKEDLNAMRKIFGECRPDVFGSSPSTKQVYEWYTGQWAEVSLVAEYNKEVVGCMEFTASGVIGIPGVLPNYQNKGIESTLFYYLLKTMQDMAKTKALADTGIIMQDAIKMYERFGFNTSRRQWGWVKKL